MDFSPLIGLVSSGFGLVFSKVRKGSTRGAWQAAAEKYGLLHKPSGFWSGPKLSGPLSGNELTVDIKDRNTASAATRFRLDTPSRNLGLKLRKKRFWNSLGPRIVTGDKAFDSQVVVTGRNEHAVRAFLTPERRAAVQSFVTSFKGAVVTDDRISLTTRGQVRNSEDMLGAIDAMTQVASVLAAATDPTPTRPAESAAAAAMAAMAMIPAIGLAAGAAKADEPARTDTLAADPAEPPDELPHVSLDAPADEPPDEPTEPAFEAAPPADPPPAETPSPDVEEFCATVFAPGALSFTANQKFRSAYEGLNVAWTGTLESMTPFTFDFDFGSARGVKAVLTILETEGAGSRDVQAVIALPPGAEGLVDRIGQRVSFTGRLLKVDGLAKRVVIADADVEALPRTGKKQ